MVRHLPLQLLLPVSGGVVVVVILASGQILAAQAAAAGYFNREQVEPPGKVMLVERDKLEQLTTQVGVVVARELLAVMVF